jgi:PBSX family phage terminase large subunit
MDNFAAGFKQWTREKSEAEARMSVKERMIAKALAGEDFKAVIPFNQKEFSRKQLEFIKGAHSRINILSGAVRSGKTYISLLYWILFILSRPKEHEYLMVGRTLTTLKRNCLGLMAELVRDSRGFRRESGDIFSYSISNKKAVLADRVIWLEGANDELAEKKIRGMTLAGAYIDEATLTPQDFFVMLLTRLSVEGARLYATTNPDAPTHWLKTEYMDNPKLKNRLTSFTFTIDDNTFLPKDFVEDAKKSHTGAFYERFILGLWVAAEGAIYKLFAASPEKFIVDKPDRNVFYVNIGVDFGGNKSASAFVAAGITRDYKRVYVLAEEYRKAAVENPETLARAFVDFCRAIKAKYPNCLYAYCDSAEQILVRGFDVAIRRAGVPIMVKNARKGDIIGRIRAVSRLMAQGRFFVCDDCDELIKALRSSSWDSKANGDKRLDNGTNNQDSIDALEYSLESEFSRLGVVE